MTTRRIAVAAALDALAVIVFVALGRRSHEESSALPGILATAAPFLIALGAAWLVGRIWTVPLAWRAGVVAWVVTVAVGMALRALVFDRGVAVGFVLVTAAVLGVALVGWRLLARLGARRRGLAVSGT